MSAKDGKGEAVYCDDCGREKMAEIRDGKLIIMDRRHGKRHIAVLPAPKFDAGI